MILKWRDLVKGNSILSIHPLDYCDLSIENILQDSSNRIYKRLRFIYDGLYERNWCSFYHKIFYWCGEVHRRLFAPIFVVNCSCSHSDFLKFIMMIILNYRWLCFTVGDFFIIYFVEWSNLFSIFQSFYCYLIVFLHRFPSWLNVLIKFTYLTFIVDYIRMKWPATII